VKSHWLPQTLFLDRFRTNEPVPSATIEVETQDGPKVATATTDGGYALPAPWLSKPGRHELLATVTAGDAVDVLGMRSIIWRTARTGWKAGFSGRLASFPRVGTTFLCRDG
jgi:hypothetical protein